MSVVVSTPITETTYASRTFYSSSTLTSSDGLFTIPASYLKRIHQVTTTDAAGSSLAIIYQDAP